MAQEDKRDDLFAINLGEDMIEVNESGKKDSDKQGDVDTIEKTEENDNLEKTDEGVLIHDDGSFEIDPFLQKTIESQAGKKGDDDEDENEDDKFIDKTESTKKTEEKETPSGKGSSDSSPSSSPFLAFAKDRAKEGVFLDFSDDQWKELVESNDGDEAAALRQLSNASIAEMIRGGVERYKESLTPEERALYEAKEKGVPVDAYAIAKKNYERYSKIAKDDLTDNTELQEELVSKVLATRGFTPEEIRDEIEGYKTLETLESKAEKALDGLPKLYKKEIEDLETAAEAEEQSRQDGLRQRVARMKNLVDNTPEIIPEIELTKSMKAKIMDSMTKPVARDANGNPLNPVMANRAKNPEAFEMMMHYYNQLGLFNIDDNGQIKPDFSKIAKIEKKKAVDDMRSVFESREKQVSGKAKSVKGKEDEEDEFDRAFKSIGNF
jgi:hypothetical protein